MRPKIKMNPETSGVAHQNRTTELSVLITALKINSDLLQVLRSISECDFPKEKYEVMVVYEIDDPAQKAEIDSLLQTSLQNAQLIKIESARNIGLNRRKLVELSRGKYLLFTDSDCQVPKDWIRIMYDAIKRCTPREAAVVGSVRVPSSTYLGNCIALLGFPGGAMVGFDKIFYVDENDHTDQISTGNCILKAQAVLNSGNFNQQYFHLEDKEMALRLIKNNYNIKYNRESYVIHPPTKSFWGYLRRQYAKGLASRRLLKDYPITSKMSKTRIKSIKNIFLNCGVSLNLPGVLFLLVFGYAAQFFGLFMARFKREIK